MAEIRFAAVILAVISRRPLPLGLLRLVLLPTRSNLSNPTQPYPTQPRTPTTQFAVFFYYDESLISSPWPPLRRTPFNTTKPSTTQHNLTPTGHQLTPPLPNPPNPNPIKHSHGQRTLTARGRRRLTFGLLSLVLLPRVLEFTTQHQPTPTPSQLKANPVQPKPNLSNPLCGVLLGARSRRLLLLGLLRLELQANPLYSTLPNPNPTHTTPTPLNCYCRNNGHSLRDLFLDARSRRPFPHRLLDLVLLPKQHTLKQHNLTHPTPTPTHPAPSKPHAKLTLSSYSDREG